MGWKSRNEPFVRHPSPSLALTPNHSTHLTWDPPGHSGEIPLAQLSDLPAVEHIWAFDGRSSHTTVSPKDFSCLTGAKEPTVTQLPPMGAPVLSLLWDTQCSAGPDTSLPTVQFPAGPFYPGRWAVVPNQPATTASLN